MTTPIAAAPSNFIRQIIDADLASGRHTRIATRFPPEPNGYLHIGHAKSICLNFGIAEDYQGSCNLRFDDTNPNKENLEFVNAIQADVRWLGFQWAGRVYYASDYFEQLYAFALDLIDQGLAYVDDLSAEAIRDYRGTLTQAGRASPYRERSIAENRDLFQRMRAGEFPDGSHVLRAKIDMTSPNINLRDPTLYRIRHGVIHHQTGAAWCLYPLYDYTHPISDALEGITHSLCTLEFEDHRPLYDWTLAHINVPCRPRQIEFSRLNLEYTVMSKRKLTQLVDEGWVNGWDDPRMPTLAGLRRRGYTPTSIRAFCERIGVTKADNLVELALLENSVREDLDIHAPRRMAVLRPLKLIIENYPDDQVEWLRAANHPKQAAMGERALPFCRELYIDQEDFREVAPKSYKRLITGGEVRLRYAYVIQCIEVLKDEQGAIQTLRCRYDPATLGQNPVGRKVAGVIHWTSARHAITAEAHLYDRLFSVSTPDAMKDGQLFTAHLNPESLRVLPQIWIEPALADAVTGERFQFEREGYFVRDINTGARGQPIFNLTVTLRDAWAKHELSSVTPGNGR